MFFGGLVELVGKIWPNPHAIAGLKQLEIMFVKEHNGIAFVVSFKKLLTEEVPYLHDSRLIAIRMKHTKPGLLEWSFSQQFSNESAIDLLQFAVFDGFKSTDFIKF